MHAADANRGKRARACHDWFCFFVSRNWRECLFLNINLRVSNCSLGLVGPVHCNMQYTICFLAGHELGYIRIGLLATRGSIEVEIIRGVTLMAPGDHPPGKTT